MPKRAKQLTVKEVRTLPPGLHCDGRNLYLRVAGGSRSWVFRYSIGGRRHDMGVGPADTIGLAEARDRVHELRRLVLNGIDPIKVRRDERAERAADALIGRHTFAECAAAYIAKNEAGWSRGHRTQWVAHFRDYVKFGDVDVAKIDTPMVIASLEPIWTTKTVTAKNLQIRIERVLEFAKSRKLRQGDNPARWKGNLSDQLARPTKVHKVKHHRALRYDEIGEFMANLRTTDTMLARALEFTILTCARSKEALGAQWSEIDLERRLWVVPPERMKTGREHRVPLSGAAIEILEAVRPFRRIDGLIFPGRIRGPLAQTSSLRVIARMGLKGVTVHGFRSSFRDWVIEQTPFKEEVAEMALAHQVGDATVRAYRRSDLFEQRRQLAEAWADFCGIPSPAKVHSIRQARPS